MDILFEVRFSEESLKIRCSGPAIGTDCIKYTHVSLVVGDAVYPAKIKSKIGKRFPLARRRSEDCLDDFQLETTIRPGSYVAKLIATNASGDHILLRTFEISSSEDFAYFNIDSLDLSSKEPGAAVISGWLFHKTKNILSVSAVNKLKVCRGSHGSDRPDVLMQYSDHAKALKSGFEIPIRLPIDRHLEVSVLLDDGITMTKRVNECFKLPKVPTQASNEKKLSLVIGYVSFIWSKANAWKQANKSLPRLSQIPDLIRKSIHQFMSLSHRGFSLNNHDGFTLSPREDPYQSWIRFNTWSAHRQESCKRYLRNISDPPLISIVMPVYNPPLEFLELALASVLGQVYTNWELCIADDCSSNMSVREYITDAAIRDNRIKYTFLRKNSGISCATNAAVRLASGTYFGFLDQDDELSPDALCEVVRFLKENPNTDCLYTDDDKISEVGERYAPQFKPDWSPELLLSYMYFSHFVVVSRQLFELVGGMRVGFEGSQDYDFVLRATEIAKHVGHIPKVLYHWRVLRGSTALSGHSKPRSFEAGQKAIQEALERRRVNATVKHPEWARDNGLDIFSLSFPDDGPLVSIIIPTKNEANILKRCLDSITRTTYKNYKIIVIDNESDDPECISLLQCSGLTVLRIGNPGGKFNYSYINNRAAEQVNGEYIVFLNNDTEIIDPRWLSQMVGYARLEGVGAVGARLLFPDKRIQHGGIIHGYYDGMAGPANKLLPSWNNGYLSYAVVSRNFLAVTAACMLVKKSLFTGLGGFNEFDFGVAYNDVDLCYRLADIGYRCVYCPDAELIHYEGYSRGFDDNPSEQLLFRQLHGHRVDGYYNPNLSYENELFQILPRAADVTRSTSRPLRTVLFAHNLNIEGAPYSQYEMVTGLKDLGIIDPIIFSPLDGPLHSLYEESEIEVIIQPHPLSGLYTEADYAHATDSLSELIQELGVDLVYANTLDTFYGIAAASKALIPSIWNIRESEPWQTYYSSFSPVICKQALNCFALPYRIVFVSNSTRHLFEPLNSINNFITIHNGLDLARYEVHRNISPRIQSRSSLNISDDEVMVLLLGTICERKGQIDLIEAIQLLSDSGIIDQAKFFVVGDRPSNYSAILHKMLKNYPQNIQDRVKLLGETSEISKYFSAADIFVCTSRVESYPRVILEAMYYGTAIISTPVFGISEQVVNNVSGIFYEPGDTVKLAEYLSLLITKSDLRSYLGRNAQVRLGRLTSYEEMLSKYARVFIEAYSTSTVCGISLESGTIAGLERLVKV